ncbi:MAG: hypothetical protein WCG80_10120 [Spirochaetales bacterium]
MKKWLLLLLVAGTTWGASAQVGVVFKVFPRDYEVFRQGERLTYASRADGNRLYQFAPGKVRINLSAPDRQPLGLQLDVKDGMPQVQAKLEPRTSLLSLVGEGATGRSPRSLAFSPDGKKLLVALAAEATIEIYDVPSLKLAGKLVPSSGTGGFTDVQWRNAQGEIWALETDGNLQIFDAKALSWKGNIPLTGGGNAYFVPPSTGRAGFYNADSGALVSIDPSTHKVLVSTSLGNAPRGVSGDDKTLYVALFDSGRLALVDTATWKVKETWAAGSAPRPVAALGDTLYVGDMGSAQLLVYSLSSKKLKATLSVGSNPHAMTVSADGKWAALATRGKNNAVDYQLPGPDFGQVSLLDATGNVVATVWGRNQPTGLAFSADSQFLAFTDLLDNNLELYRIK